MNNNTEDNTTNNNTTNNTTDNTSDKKPAPQAPGSQSKGTPGGRRKSSWMKHVQATMKSEAGKKKSMGKKWFSHVLKTAKNSYKKSGGALNPMTLDEPKTGGRRNKTRKASKKASRKTRKNRKH